jgi:hypothetical protein
VISFPKALEISKKNDEIIHVSHMEMFTFLKIGVVPESVLKA